MTLCLTSYIMQLFERVNIVAKQLAGSQTKLAAILSLRQKQFNGYLNAGSERNLWEHLPAILTAFPDVRRDWLFFGEGEMLKSDTPAKEAAPATPEPVQAEQPKFVSPYLDSDPAYAPLRGFASCGLDGWSGTMPFTMAIPMPNPRPAMFAVTASGDSMIPEGIGNGHICFCDPNATPIPGESVYVELSSNKAALKAFLGWDVVAGERFIVLKGWHDRTPDKPQKSFTIRELACLVTMLAPVVYVQRRL